MTQVFLTVASGSPWTVPKDFSADGADIVNLPGGGFTNFGANNGVDFQFVGQSFTTGSTVKNVTSIAIELQVGGGAPTDGIFIEIRAGGSSFSGTLLGTSATINPPTNTLAWQTFLFTPAVNLAASTQYTFVVKRSGALDSGNLWAILLTSGSTYAGGTCYGSLDGVAWTDQTKDINFFIGGSHKVELVGAGGNGAAGTTGATGNAGGGGGSAGYYGVTYTSGTMTPGTTTVPFRVDSAGGLNVTCWQNTTNTNANYVSSGSNGVSGGSGGSGGAGATAGSPSITYATIIATGGNGGGAGGATRGGGGGAGAAGFQGQGGAGGAATAAGGAGGGGSNNGGAGANSASTNGGNGGFGGPTGTGGGGASSTAGTGNNATAGTGGGGGGGASRTTTGTCTAGGAAQDSSFDSTHGSGGGAGGAGACTGNVTATITGANSGDYGGGGGGCGYGRGTTTFNVGSGGNGLIVVFYQPSIPQGWGANVDDFSRRPYKVVPYW